MPPRHRRIDTHPPGIPRHPVSNPARAREYAAPQPANRYPPTRHTPASGIESGKQRAHAVWGTSQHPSASKPGGRHTLLWHGPCPGPTSPCHGRPAGERLGP
jgi:hypothetical protein